MFLSESFGIYFSNDNAAVPKLAKSGKNKGNPRNYIGMSTLQDVPNAPIWHSEKNDGTAKWHSRLARIPNLPTLAETM